MLVYGDGGAGKTTLTIDLAFALALGAPWLGLVETDRKLRVALIEAEGPRQEFREKLARKLKQSGGAELDGRIVVLEEPWAEFSFADEPQRRGLALAITEHEIDLLVVGPVAAVGMVGGGTPDEIRAFEELLKQLRALVDLPFAILLVHHESKIGRVSGAWERVPDTLIHVQGQGHGRTRVYWQKVRWSSALHGTATQLVWAEGDSFTVEGAREPVSEDTIAASLLEAVRDHPGLSWTKLREQNDDDGNRLVKGTNTSLEKVRDRLILAGELINTSSTEGRFKLWHHNDPACIRSDARTDPERLPFAPAASEGDADPFAVRPYKGRTERTNGSAPEPQTFKEEFPAADEHIPF